MPLSLTALTCCFPLSEMTTILRGGRARPAAPCSARAPAIPARAAQHRSRSGRFSSSPSRRHWIFQRRLVKRKPGQMISSSGFSQLQPPGTTELWVVPAASARRATASNHFGSVTRRGPSSIPNASPRMKQSGPLLNCLLNCCKITISLAVCSQGVS